MGGDSRAGALEEESRFVGKVVSPYPHTDLELSMDLWTSRVSLLLTVWHAILSEVLKSFTSFCLISRLSAQNPNSLVVGTEDSGPISVMQSSLGITSVPHFQPCNNSAHYSSLLCPTPYTQHVSSNHISLPWKSCVPQTCPFQRPYLEMITPSWKNSSHTNSMEKGIYIAIFQAS